MAIGLVFVLAVVACAPSTPVPSTPTFVGPTAGPSVQPTQNFRATEVLIISHVFATMTASAPTPVKVANTPVPVATTAVKATPAATAKPKAVTPKPTNTAAAVAPQATKDPYLAQIPKGKGGILLVSYIGTTVNFTIPGAGCANDACPVDPNGRRLIVVDPGTYTVSVQVIGPPGGGWSDTVTVPMDRYITYWLTVNP